ncbi:MAG: hypothetical protein IJQ39_13385 [Thermoguttaceae bacterium]|nr:hypothetical protein [Thermoguttaceae bacterium]
MTTAGWCFMLTACIIITSVFVWCIIRVLLSSDDPVKSEKTSDAADDEQVNY